MLITCSFGTTNTGVDVYITLLNPDMSVYVPRTNTGVEELIPGSGVYGVEMLDENIYGKTALWDIDGTNKAASETFYSAEVDISEINWSDLWQTMPTGTSVRVVSPVYLGGDVEIVHGDDYATPESRELEWADTDHIWPDLAGCTLIMTIAHKGKIEATINTVMYDAVNEKITAQIFSSDTCNLSVGKLKFDIQATFPNGRKATIVLGVITVLQDYTE